MIKTFSVILLLVALSSSASFAAPASTTPASPQSPTTGESASPVPQAAGSDGYSQMAQYWTKLEQQARDLEKTIQAMYAEIITGLPNDKSRVNTFFSQKLADKYPGSSYNGIMGTISLPNSMVAHFTQDLKIDRIEELGKINVNYFLSQGKFSLSNGTNSISATVNKNNPSQSLFIKAIVPPIKAEAENILSSQGAERVALDSPEVAVLNDAFQLLAQTNKVRMDIFAGYVISSPEWQKQVIDIASKGYRDRHPEEFGKEGTAKKKAADTDAPRLKGKYSSSNTLVNALVVLVLIAGCFGFIRGIFYLIGYLRFRRLQANVPVFPGLAASASGDADIEHVFMGLRESMKEAEKERDQVEQLFRSEYARLTPLIMKFLDELGRQCYGPSLFFWKKFRTFKYKEFCIWGLEANNVNPLLQMPNRISISIRLKEDLSPFMAIEATYLDGPTLTAKTKDVNEETMKRTLLSLITS